MARGNIATGLALLLAGSLTIAQPARSDDGCSTLAALVHESVYRAATEYKPELPQPKSASSLQASALAYRQACLRTVEVATSAFTRALADLGLTIGWYPPHPGNYCWSGDLAECYPGPQPGKPELPPHQLAFVYDAWRGVQKAMMSHMRQGSASGASTFTAQSLDAALWSNLQLTVDGPLYLSHAYQ
ncbi:MAG TPA: hypothetical protein VHG33_01265 [Woeseiaceae bacterium]|nr:hypothetical protein [Woeseiaceae bacterium]